MAYNEYTITLRYPLYISRDKKTEVFIFIGLHLTFLSIFATTNKVVKIQV